ncbi:hypothetical protein J6590_013093, partial [Homalodisca vitripennis]
MTVQLFWLCEFVTDKGDLQFTFRSWLWTVSTAIIQVTILYSGIIYRIHSPHFWENYLKVLENVLRFVFTCTIPPLISSWFSTPLLIDYVKEWHSFETLGCSPKAKTIRSQRLLWLKLQHLASQLPVVFSVPLITQLLMYFFTYIFSSYSLIRSISDNKLERIVGFSSPFLWCIIVFISLNESSYYLDYQVGRVMLLSMLSTRSQSLSLDARRELMLLIDSIKMSLDMELSGCVTLGRTFMIQ